MCKPPHIFIILCVFILSACQNDQTYHLALPANFPIPTIPENNTLTSARIALGKKLFYDPILSIDTTLSCVSCHKPALAFSDSVPISPGVHGRLGFRNAPSLANTAYLDLINKDGGVVKLDMQAVVPIEDEDEMGLPLVYAAQRLREHPEYPKLCKEAYDQPPNPFVITRALAAFQRTMISGNSLYDQYMQGKKDALDSAQIRGMELFFSDRTQCSECHAGFNFTTNQFENNGLKEDYSGDLGRQRVTSKEKDEGKFRVPSLRNIAVTAPYMHDGSVPTLQAVITHYNSGGKQHPNKSNDIQPLKLSPQEQSDMIRFLEALTDSMFLYNPEYRAEI